MGKVTIKELAEMAGVSTASVSFVLNGKPGVSDETRKKIMEIIEKVGYTSNFHSRCLVLKKSFNIALLYSESSSPFVDLFYYEVARGALEQCNKNGYNIVLNTIQTKKQDDGSFTLPDIITSKNADGVLIFQDADPEIVKAIEDNSIPVVVVDSYDSAAVYTSIGISARGIVFSALEYLISAGHRDIGIVATGYIPDLKKQIGNAVDEFYKAHGLSLKYEWYMDNASNGEDEISYIENVMNQSQKPTAIFCTSDIYALAIMEYLKKRGIQVPEDISIIGADNIIASKYTCPSLTTVDYDKVNLGKRACDLLFDRINGQRADSVRLEPSGIAVRDSVKKIV